MRAFIRKVGLLSIGVILGVSLAVLLPSLGMYSANASVLVDVSTEVSPFGLRKGEEFLHLESPLRIAKNQQTNNTIS